MRISDWSSDLCSSDLRVLAAAGIKWPGRDAFLQRVFPRRKAAGLTAEDASLIDGSVLANAPFRPAIGALRNRPAHREVDRSEEHTSELQSLMRISYAVFCLQKKNTRK